MLEKSEVMKDAMEQLVTFIRNNNYSNQAGIVYAFSRKEASDVAAGLASRGIPAAFYHAGQEVRENAGFHSEDSPVLRFPPPLFPFFTL